MQNTFTGVFEKIEDWYIGYVQELPGAIILKSNRELAEKELLGKDVIREQIIVNI